jgi:hypothetical protein
MTERTIRALAVELAGQFYDTVRSAEKAGEKVHIRRASTGRAIQQIDPTAFGKTYPRLRDYLAGTKYGTVKHLPNGAVVHVNDGRIDHGPPGWMHWYDAARQMLVEMLARPDIDERRKEQIMDALVEDRDKQHKQEEKMIKSPAIPQRRFIDQ